jgi:DNA polymerase III subunit chi
LTLPHVSFYLLNESVPDGKLRAACRLTRKAVSQGYTVYILTSNDEQARRLDDLLWTFEQGSFVPHRIDGDQGDPAPVVIGSNPPEADPPSLLISLSRDTLNHFHVYRRIAEFVDFSDEDRQLARKLYRTYRERGCQLDTHHIKP